jgi:hypothetical protein
VNIDINDIKIKTYYIDCVKWNECFCNKNFNKDFLKNIKKKDSQEIEKNKNHYYEIYGNYDDKCFTKISYYIKERDKTKKKYKDGKEKCWTVYIKNEKIYEILKIGKKVNIMDYSYYYDKHENILPNDIIISKYNKKLKIIYKNNEEFFIIPNLFYNCKICKVPNTDNMYSIIFYIDLLNIEHIEFKEFINKIYNRLIVCIDEQEEINLNIINPIKSHNLFYANFCNFSRIINIKNDKNIELNTLYNKLFIGYPIFTFPKLNTKNNKIYINFDIYKIYINMIS